MAENIRVTLGGIALDSFGTVKWRIAAGVDPVQEYIECHINTAEALLGLKDTAQQLVFKIPGRPDEVFDGIWILSAAPTNHPDSMAILISDIRWKWSRKLIKRSFNIRRHTGARRRLGPAGTPIQVAPITDDVDFQPWSLMKADGTPTNGADGGLKWTPRASIDNVMGELSSGEGFAFEWQFDENAISGELSFEGIQIIDQGSPALSRLLGYVPMTDLFVDRHGKVRFFNKLSGLESVEVTNRVPYVDGAIPRLINFDQVRPKEVNVYFTPEIEVRFDSVTSGSTVTSDQRFITNVLPLPNPTTTMNGKEYVYGTWFPFGQTLYDSWNASSPAKFPLSDDLIRLWWWSGKLDQLFSRLGGLAPLEAWVPRCAAIKHHYRQTFQINRRWMDRMHSIRAHRVGILDPENGTRAPSQAYTDYCIRAEKPRVAAIGANGNSVLGLNVFGYAVLLKDAKPAPVEVHLVDQDLGILHFSYVADPWGITAEFYPSAVDRLPTADISNLSQPLWWYGAKVSGGSPGMPQLSASYQAAVVITAAPAAPNDLRQMYKRTVTPAEVQNVQGVGVGAANGPPFDVWVGPQITARFMWSDNFATKIDAAFAAGGLAETDLSPLLVNEDDVANVAKAVAAEIYASYTNRYQGGLTTMLDSTIEPSGNLKEVTHAVEANGTPHTSLSLPAERSKLDPWSILPASTRAIINREVQR